MFAASLGDCDIVKILLDKNASINEFASPHDWNPLCCALQANNKDVVRILLDVETLRWEYILVGECRGIEQ